VPLAGGVLCAIVAAAALPLSTTVMHRVHETIFRTRSAEVVQICMLLFNCLFLLESVVKRNYKFLANYVKCDNIIMLHNVKTLRHMN